MEKSPITGNVLNPVSQISLIDAQNMLKDKINNGEFKFTINNKYFTVAEQSLIDLNEKVSSPFMNSIYYNILL